jgi:class 3 adenylate cyclase
MESTVTVWEPPTRLEFRSPVDDDGMFHVFDYAVEAREGGSTVRWTHSGALGGSWETEYEGIRNLPGTVGLSIGLDAGPGHVHIADELTVVGPPVVGAVRMVTAASAPGEIVANVFLGRRLEEEQEGVYRELGLTVISEHRPTKEYPQGQEVYALTFDRAPPADDASATDPPGPRA